eukprot:gene9432-987_t
MSLAAVLDLCRECWERGRTPAPEPDIPPADWRRKYLARDGSFLTWTCEGPSPKRDNLRRCMATWVAMGAPDWILSAIKEGFRPVQHARLAPAWMDNSPSAHQHSEFVDTAVKAMAQAGHFLAWDMATDGAPTLVVPLAVAISGAEAKRRLIIDCRAYNMAEVQFDVSLPTVLDLTEDIRQQLLVRAEASLFKFDLRSGYHHVPMHDRTGGYVVVCWRRRLYRVASLPFGLGSAVSMFQALMMVLARTIEHDTPVKQYIDDTCGIQPSDGSFPHVSRILRE